MNQHHLTATTSDMFALAIVTLILLLIIVGVLGYVVKTVYRISYRADLLVNVVIPWMNYISTVVIPNFTPIPVPPIKG